MKCMKYLLIIALFIVFVIQSTSCVNQSSNEITDTPDTATQTPNSQPTAELSNNFKPDISDIVYLDMVYLSYEGCIQISDNVVEAKLEEVEHLKKCNKYKFKVEKQYKGEIEEEYIYVVSNHVVGCVTFSDMVINYATYEAPFIIGKSYLLDLVEYPTDVYQPSRVYNFTGETVIPIDDLSKSTIYVKAPLKKHSKITDEMLSDYSLFIEYVKSCIKKYDHQNESLDVPYVKSDKTEDIVSGSDFIFKVKINSIKDYTDVYGFTLDSCNCEILTVYKGEAKNNQINIRFFPDVVKKGGEYIVALNSLGFDFIFYLSSNNSVFDVSRESEIVGLTEKYPIFDKISVGMTYKEITDLMGVECVKEKRAGSRWDLEDGKKLYVIFQANQNSPTNDYDLVSVFAFVRGA